MTEDFISSLVVRRMRQSSGFVLSESAPPPASIELVSNERLIGWCRNPPPWELEFVVFSTRAIHVADGKGVVRVLFEEIVGYELLKDSGGGYGANISTRSGDRFVRMAGSYGPEGKFQDVFSLARLLRGLIRQGKR